MMTKPMTIEDYLAMMKANDGIYPEYDALSLEDKRKVAQFQIDTGIAESHYLDGELIGVTGIRHRGIGEPWFITTPEMRTRKFWLFKRTKRTLKRMRNEVGLVRMFATSKINENFLLHLGFVKDETQYVWTRME